MRIRELRDGLEVEDDEREQEGSWGGGGDGEVVAVVRLRAKRALVGAGARVLFYPTLLYNVLRNRFDVEFRWWDRVDKYVLLGAVPFSSDVPRLKQLGVRGVVTLNEPYETLVPTSLYQAHGINHLEIPTRDYLFAPSLEHICRAVDFIHCNEMQGGSTYVHCKAGRGRSTTIVLCFLIKYRNMTPQAALDHARSVRPRVLLAPAQWKAVKMFSELNRRCLSIQSSNPTCSAVSYEESSELSSTRSSRCLSIQSSNEDSITSDEESSESSFGDPEVDGYVTTEFDREHFVSPCCRSMLSRPTSPTGCSDAVFITEEDLEGYETYADDGKDVVEVQVVVRHKPIMRKLSCFLGSLKLTGNCEPQSGRLTEVRAC
ncbi:phosphatidylglycerophosphate phosphatase PTPMT2-like [Miscanthus floridulus]|uniref:phosphatidylglycerophosphate phosphatase PTPMT2-like n=1 Tax=Miscanthus floridulus TaxID=154761 RepID=UPI0034575C02